MIKLDDNLLQELGLGILPPEEKKKMLAHIYETLEMRVGMALAKQMNDGQLNEFEQFIKSNDEAGALRWLETNFPNYRDVVAAEFEKLKAEVKQTAPQIVAASQQAGVQPAPAYPQLAQAQDPAAAYGAPQNPYAAPPAGAQSPMAPGGPQPAAMPPQQPYGPSGPAPQPGQQMPPQAAPQYGMPQPPQPQPVATQPGYYAGAQGQPQPATAQPVAGQPTQQPPAGQPFDPQSGQQQPSNAPASPPPFPPAGQSQNPQDPAAYQQ